MPRFDLAGNPMPEDPATPPVRYDLAGNPIAPPPAPLQGGHSQPGRPPTYPNPLSPGGTHVGISAEHLIGTRPSDGLAERIMDNSSGALDDVPAEVEKLHWNWGAFLVPSFWALNHGMKPLAFAIWGLGIVLHFAAQVQTPLNTALGVVYTVLCLGVSLWLGFCGNRIAWRIRRFEGGLDEFFAVQKAWTIAGFCVLALSIVLGGKITPGIALYPLHNITRPVNADKTDYEIFYGGKPPL